MIINLNPAKKQEIDRELFKKARQAIVDSITVNVNGKVFDGDEVSQGRMARALVAMSENDTIVWVLADNTPTQVTQSELIEALRLAGLAQAEAWVQQ